MEDESELIVADIPDTPQKLICIEFPGVVEDEAAAIRRLGGLDVLSKTHSDGRRLEMRFRPDDIYSKPTMSKTVAGSNLILKIRRKKITLKGKSDIIPQSEVKVEYSAELLGICNRTYQFSGLADFQVLPPGLNAVGYKGLPVDPNDFQLKEPLDVDFPNRDIPSFLPPSCFSKFDKPINYMYRPYFKSIKSQRSNDDGSTSFTQSKHIKSKKFNLAYSVSFESLGVPKKPNPDAFSFINPNNPLIPRIEELFKVQPVWSTIALQWRLKSTQIRIRSVLPLFAYYFSSGPFKRLWVKLGYDPRTEPSNKIYQSLDIRVPKSVTLELQSHKQSDLMSETMVEEAFIFNPSKLPSQRQMFYQLCDIHDQEGQDLIHSNDGKETECTEINGWCEENTYDKVRKLLTSKIRSLAARKNIEP